ncbi:MAG: septum formation protein Maf [Spirochaetaceae bacterium]|nr:septum formation protein Maf [Spirochaetaceae bacterium]
MEAIILASSSPRRQEILKKLGIPFRVIMPEIDENVGDDVELEQIPELLAIKKVRTVIQSFPQNQIIPWVFGADTMIICDGVPYGKPASAEEAAFILQTLSGKTHKVITSIALFNGNLNHIETKTNITEVTFKELTESEIEWYINTGEWHGAAGAYRIQDLASCFISKINGSYSSVIGLPIFEFYEILKEQGYELNI